MVQVGTAGKGSLGQNPALTSVVVEAIVGVVAVVAAPVELDQVVGGQLWAGNRPDWALGKPLAVL